MSFAQRKFLGYRCKFEYDSKAVLLFSHKQVVLITYTLESLGESTFTHKAENKRPQSDHSDSQESDDQVDFRGDPLINLAD